MRLVIANSALSADHISNTRSFIWNEDHDTFKTARSCNVKLKKKINRMRRKRRTSTTRWPMMTPHGPNKR